jgi:hypothetical protein
MENEEIKRKKIMLLGNKKNYIREDNRLTSYL